MATPDPETRDASLPPTEPNAETPASAAPAQPDLIGLALGSVESAKALASAAWDLVRAEFALARQSALHLVLLGFGLIFFGVVAWLGLAATLTVGLLALTGNLFLSVVLVTAANIAASWLIFLAMRRRFRNLSMPRTRELILTRSLDIPPEGPAHAETKAP